MLKKYKIVNLAANAAEIAAYNKDMEDEKANSANDVYYNVERDYKPITEEQQAVLFYIQSISDPKTGFYTQSFDEIALSSGFDKTLVKNTVHQLNDSDFGVITIKMDRLNKKMIDVVSSPEFLEMTDWTIDDNGVITEIKKTPDDTDI
ncbi:hypothetical protein [Photobacterium phosphoreum]|uniref:hypothetical protein n=1 Tax=Photobacterium phosphoreum TaxID=659 RepID=UPI000D17FDBA|nr:hypothetical protein [Photobacterium phosphoreum]PSU32161.1 hypothetical protein CTM85_20190 [Photobacterium phosphoreum]